MKIKNLLIIYCMLFIILSAQKQISYKDNLNYQKKIIDWMAEYNVPALGIGIIEDGKISYSNVFGEHQKGISAPKNTIFNVASIMKTVTTMLTLNLVESGKWDLDAPLYQYWVDPDVKNDPLHKKLTTFHILTHQTGFVNWRWNHPTKKLTFDFEPGTKSNYSGEGFEYLKRALEKKFDKPFEKLVDSLIFKQLWLTDSKLTWDYKFDESRFAAWYDSEGEKYNFPYKTFVSAADDLLTTIGDYCRFGIFTMNGGGLSSTLFNKMVSPQADIQKYKAQGLGWSIIKGLPNDEYLITHSGSDWGVNTMAFFLPKSKRGLVLFTNSDNGFLVINNIIKNTFDIGNDIYEAMIYRPNLPKIITVSDKVLDKYIGKYKQPDGNITVVSKKDNSIVLVGAFRNQTTFYPEAETKFFVKEWDATLEFISNETGEITKMIINMKGNKYSEAEKIK